MKKTLTEQKVLEQLGIKDFRHMTKDCVVEFASMLPYMDPDVAKKALEQFPEFKQMASDITSEYSSIVKQAFTENTTSQNTFYATCNTIIDSLKTELESENISDSERARIEDNMIAIAKMIGEKDSENKVTLQKILIIAGAFGLTILGTAITVLGANSRKTTQS